MVGDHLQRYTALSPSLGCAAADYCHGLLARLPKTMSYGSAGAGGIGYHQTPRISDQFVPRDEITIWIALDDADEVNGAVQYAVGSHKGGRKRDGLRSRQMFHVAGIWLRSRPQRKPLVSSGGGRAAQRGARRRDLPPPGCLASSRATRTCSLAVPSRCTSTLRRAIPNGKAS